MRALVGSWNVKITYSEGQIGWIPYALERADNTWEFHSNWTLALRGDWTQRKSATSVEIGQDDLDTQRWGAGAMLAYRITRNLTGSVRYQYGKQRSKGNTAGRFSDFEGHVASLGFNYALDPIEVW